MCIIVFYKDLNQIIIRNQLPLKLRFDPLRTAAAMARQSDHREEDDEEQHAPQVLRQESDHPEEDVDDVMCCIRNRITRRALIAVTRLQDAAAHEIPGDEAGALEIPDWSAALDEIPGDDGEEAAAHEIPDDEAAAHEIPGDQAAAHEIPGDEAGALDEIPDWSAALDEIPGDEAAALDEIPGDEAAAHEIPGDEAAAHEIPGDQAAAPVALIAARRVFKVHDCREVAHISYRYETSELSKKDVKYGNYFIQDKAHHGTAAAEAKALACSRDTIRQKRVLTASLALQLERCSWMHIEKSIAQRAEASEEDDKVELLLYLAFDSYDAVDLTLVEGQPQKADVAALPDEAPGVPADVVGAEMPADVGVQMPQKHKEVGVQKIVQSDGYIMLFVKHRGKHFVLQGNHASALQVADRCTGETLFKQINDRFFGSHDVAEKFDLRCRLVAIDGAGSNDRAERHWLEQHPLWSSLVVHCHVHMLYAVHKKTFSLVDPDLTGLINIALCVRGGRQMVHLKAALARVLMAKLKFVRGHCSEAAMKHKHFVLDLYFGHDKWNVGHKILLLRCAPGNFMNHDAFEYILRPGESEEDAKQTLKKYLVPFLCRRAWRIYPRSRWIGADKSFADVGIWASIHYLLEHTFMDYLVVTHKFVLPKKLGRGVDPAGLLAIADGVADEEAPEIQVGGAAEVSARSNDKGEGERDYAAENRIQRQKAFEWLMIKPADRIMIMKYILDPMMVYMLSEIDSASYHLQSATLHENIAADEIGSGKLLGDKLHFVVVA